MGYGRKMWTVLKQANIVFKCQIINKDIYPVTFFLNRMLVEQKLFAAVCGVCFFQR